VADPALITGGTAVLTGGVGYLTARLQHKAEKQRLVLEETRLKGELETQRRERETAVVQDRQDLYLSFLKTFDAAWHLCHDPGILSTTDADDWWSVYKSDQQRMTLLAAGPVAKSVDEYRPLLSAFAEDLEAEIEQNTSDKAAQEKGRRSVWDRHADPLLTKQREIEGHMREDLRTPE
jgi:hypothetical protein